MKKARPIAFSGSMIRAILEGRKTQTRRLVRWPFDGAPSEDHLDNLGDCYTIVARRNGKDYFVECPTGIIDDVLWAREAFRLPGWMDSDSPAEALAREGDRLRGAVEYLADQLNTYPEGRYRAARFMPRAVSRLDLVVADFACLERVESISEEDARAEGIFQPTPYSLFVDDRKDPKCSGRTAREAYVDLFYRLNPALARGSNPFVWATTFRR